MVTIWVKPDDAHAAEASYLAERQETRYGERFVAQVPFGAEGTWQVRLTVESSAGDGETAFPVRVTPPGVEGLWLVICWLPFVFLGGFGW